MLFFFLLLLLFWFYVLFFLAFCSMLKCEKSCILLFLNYIFFAIYYAMPVPPRWWTFSTDLSFYLSSLRKKILFFFFSFFLFMILRNSHSPLYLLRYFLLLILTASLSWKCAKQIITLYLLLYYLHYALTFCYQVNIRRKKLICLGLTDICIYFHTLAFLRRCN